MKANSRMVCEADWLLLPMFTAGYTWFMFGQVTPIKLVAVMLLLLGVLGMALVRKPLVRSRRIPFFEFVPPGSDAMPTGPWFHRFMSGGLLVAGMLLCVFLAGGTLFFVVMDLRLHSDPGGAIAIAYFACSFAIYLTLLVLTLAALRIDGVRKELVLATLVGLSLILAMVFLFVSRLP